MSIVGVVTKAGHVAPPHRGKVGVHPDRPVVLESPALEEDAHGGDLEGQV